MRILFFFVLSCLIAYPVAAQIDEKAKKVQQLTQLKSRIEKLRKTIEVKENSRSSYIRQLRDIEKKIGTLGRQIRKTGENIQQQKKQVKKLKQQTSQLRQQLARQNSLLASQIYTAYTLGQQEQIKLLLSQQDPGELQRNLTYYRYFSDSRARQIAGIQLQIHALAEKEQEVASAQQQLEKALQQKRQQKTRLSRDRIQREQILSTLEKELKKQGRYLSRLEENAKNLRQLINSLSEILTDNPSEQMTQKFSRLKGKLSWPVKGRVKKLFGHRKPPSDLRWQGVMINAPRGNNVRAIAHGRVAFSDWLRGMGNLIIIDHGDGYLSLYGHNESLFKSAGEWVDAGEIIASIGNSGGHQKPGLYFEIRRKGKPQNPTRWCKAGNWFRQI